MVPSLERTEYMLELRGIAENIVRERLEHAEVHPLTHSGPALDDSSCEVAQSHPELPTHIGSSAKAAVTEHVVPSVEPHFAVEGKESRRMPSEVDVEPVFHIPMTQARSLEDLPSQLDFDWQDSVSQMGTPAPNAARNLDGELDVVCTPRSAVEPISTPMDTFVEVSQIVEEAVRDVMPQPSAPVPTPATDAVDAHASII
jgi:hypothetical protein